MRLLAHPQSIGWVLPIRRWRFQSFASFHRLIRGDTCLEQNLGRALQHTVHFQQPRDVSPLADHVYV